MRFEAKHRLFKKVVYDTHNWRNVLLIHSSKHQQMMAYHLDNQKCFKPKLYLDNVKVFRLCSSAGKPGIAPFRLRVSCCLKRNSISGSYLQAMGKWSKRWTGGLVRLPQYCWGCTRQLWSPLFLSSLFRFCSFGNKRDFQMVWKSLPKNPGESSFLKYQKLYFTVFPT